MSAEIIAEIVALQKRLYAINPANDPLIRSMQEKWVKASEEYCERHAELRQELLDKIESLKAQLRPTCKHEHLNMEGICHACGADCRGTS